MYVDFKEETEMQSGLGGGLLWMLSGIMMGLLAGLAMYYFSNRGIPSVDAANAAPEGQVASNDSSKNTADLFNKQVGSAFGQSNQKKAPEDLMVASLIDKNNKKEEVKQRPSFSYYAVLPDLNVPIQTIRNPTPKEIEKAEAEKIRKRKERDEALQASLNPETEKKETKAVSDSRYRLQIASFKQRKHANREKRRLKRKGVLSIVEERRIRSRRWYRVITNAIDENQLAEWKSRVEILGHKPLVIPVD
ncbi:MAG: SPOR domain-containing protein [Cocleimonas sp.]|nr:SPOR domain-containing protein [Cocleimonas sp.]